MKYYNKFLILFLLNIMCVLVIQFSRSDNTNSYMVTTVSNVVTGEIQNAIETSNITQTNKKILIIYNAENEEIMNQATEIKDRLANMKLDSQMIKDDNVTNQSFDGYDAVIVMSNDWENSLGWQLYELIKFAENGGKVLFGVMPDSIDGPYKGIYRSIGVMTYSSYTSIEGFKFDKELMTGSKGMSFVNESDYGNTCINLEVDKDCEVYMSSDGNIPDIPILWSKSIGNGTIVVYNSTGLGGRYFAGIFAGAMTVLEEDLLYPIINAKTIFIDDFPAPQYNLDSEVIEKNYNRNVKEFYRDIWWPDMQKAANQFKYKYTGLFISSYNNDIDTYEIEEDPNFKYYGNSLLKNGFEIGLHGYNHQPLVLEGFTPEDMGYVAWKSQEDMAESIATLDEYAENLFPNTRITVYVPPSNFLSPEGRKAVAEADPDLSVVSGVYEADGNEYQQDFAIAEDGIKEYPRLTSGMWNDVTTRMQYMCGITMYGVFSHFVHPDDILDEERGKGADWDTLYENYTGILEGVNTACPLRALNASDAGEALQVYNNLKVKLEYEEKYIKGACDNFTGEAYFYIRTSKTPLAVNDSCMIEKADKENGEFFYVVTVKEPEFEIKLEDK